MRNTFIKELTKLAAQDPNLYLFVGDLGFSVMEDFEKKFPNRFFNIGVAEQSMIGVAAGMAMAGKNVFVYSIVPFATMRCFEQIRDDICYQQLPVKIIGTGGGLDYGPYGATHHSIEDIGIMRMLPGMTVLAPGSATETAALTQTIAKYNKPVYLRLSRSTNTVPYQENTEIKLGTSIEIIPNNKQLLITTGNMLDLGYELCTQLKKKGLDLGLVSMPTVKPFCSDIFTKYKDTLQTVFTLEEHNVVGGFGEAIGSYLLSNFNRNIAFKNFGVQDEYVHVAGKSEYVKATVGINPKDIEKNISKQLI